MFYHDQIREINQFCNYCIIKVMHFLIIPLLYILKKHWQGNTILYQVFLFSCIGLIVIVTNIFILILYYRTLYWTDWVISPGVGNPSINSVSMDGTQWNTIESRGIQWPNGLVLDTAKDTLYWTEAFYDRIESMSTTGEKRKVNIFFFTLWKNRCSK